MNRRLERLRSMVTGESTRAFGSVQDLLEPKPQMCFQVYVLVNERGVNAERFDALVEKYDIDVHEELKSGYFDPPLEPFEFCYEGMVRQEKNGDKYFFDFLLQPVFQTTNSKVLRAVDELAKQDIGLHTKNDFVHEVGTQYGDALKREIPNIEFKNPLWARTKNLTVKFYFAIQPYTPDLCPPEDLDVLKPITIIDGHEIHPAADRVDLSSVAKATSRQP